MIGQQRSPNPKGMAERLVRSARSWNSSLTGGGQSSRAIFRVSFNSQRTHSDRRFFALRRAYLTPRAYAAYATTQRLQCLEDSQLFRDFLSATQLLQKVPTRRPEPIMS